MTDQSPWTPAEDARLAALWTAGETMQAMMDRLGRREWQIRARARRLRLRRYRPRKGAIVLPPVELRPVDPSEMSPLPVIEGSWIKPPTRAQLMARR